MPLSMSTVIVNTWIVGDPLDKPKDGPRLAAVLANLSMQAQGLDISQLFMSQRLNCILAAFIDNSANSNSFTLTIQELGYNVTLAAGWQGWFSFPVPSNFAKLVFSSNTVTGNIPLFFANTNFGTYSWLA
jgi:hypothetical protein